MASIARKKRSWGGWLERQTVLFSNPVNADKGLSIFRFDFFFFSSLFPLLFSRLSFFFFFSLPWHFHTMQQAYYGRDDDSDRLSYSSLSSSTVSVVSEQSRLLPYKSKQTQDTTYKHEFRWLCINSFPIILTYLLQNSFQLASIFVLGHIVRQKAGGRVDQWRH